jgi:hypothetical protein
VASSGQSGSQAHHPLLSVNVLVVERLERRVLGAIMPIKQIGERQLLARTLLDAVLGEVMLEGMLARSR